MKMAGLLALAFIALALLFVLWLWPSLRHQATYPGGRLEPGQGDPARHGLPDAEEVWLEAADGVRIHGWWIPARLGRSAAGGRSASGRCGAAIYFHGNANTIVPRAWLGRRLAVLGLDVLLFDYRGYGLSEGRPTEAGLRLDARAAYDHVVETRGVDADRLILFGHSLGSAVATDLALEREAAALVLGAPFGGFPGLFRHHAPWLPLRALPWGDGRYDAGSRIGALRMPVLIALGEADQVIPPEFSRAVYEAVPEPKRLVETDAEHGELIGDPAVWDALETLVRHRLGC